MLIARRVVLYNVSNILFIQASPFEYESVKQLSACLKSEGHRVHLIFSYSSEKGLIEVVNQFDPDLIAFSAMDVDRTWVLQKAAFLKQQKVRALIVVGGPLPTFHPNFIENDNIDIINVGEGERSIVALANAIERHEDFTGIQNLHVKKDGTIYRNPLGPLIDINTLPLPDFDIYLEYPLFRDVHQHNFLVSRGCLYACSFCCMPQWNELYKDQCKGKRSLRLKSVETCMHEIDAVRKKTKLEFIEYDDSSFCLDKEWTLAFFRAYAQNVRIPFSINVRPNLLTEEIVKAIKETGCCDSIRLGIETGSETIRKGVLNKHISNASIDRAIALLRKYKIKSIAYLMFGLPGETFDEACMTIEMMHKLKPFAASSNLFHPYPNLDITKYAIEHDSLQEEDIAKLGKQEYGLYKSILHQPELDEVTNLYKLSTLAIHFRSLYPLIKRLACVNLRCLYNVILNVSRTLSYMKWHQLHLGKMIRHRLFLKEHCHQYPEKEQPDLVGEPDEACLPAMSCFRCNHIEGAWPVLSRVACQYEEPSSLYRYKKHAN